ncbi:MAG: hypothetical protein HYU97_04530 [Deltaproteobacteria bacterium]|nr:hypothetical protein [Deltaproteobacteria bacterium]
MNILSKLRRMILWTFRLGLVGAIPYSLYRHDFLFIFGVLLSLLATLLPAYWYRSLKVTLPFELDLLISLALFLHIILGEVLRFYDNVWYFDKIMHFYGTSIIALLAFLIVFSFHYSGKVVLSLPLIAIFTIIFAMAVGSLWEIGEFTVDHLFKRNTQYSLDNTMWDLIFNTVGGTFAAVFGALYTRRKNAPELSQMLDGVKKIIRS